MPLRRSRPSGPPCPDQLTFREQVGRRCIITLAEGVEAGIEKRQRTIGFRPSLAAVEMLELYLHKIAILPVTFRLNHAWMKSQKKPREKIPHDFPKKDEIIRLISYIYIEKNRDILCYGKAANPSLIQEQLEHFWKLRNLFKEGGLDELP